MGNRKALGFGMSSKHIMLKVREDGDVGNKEIIGIDSERWRSEIDRVPPFCSWVTTGHQSG